MPKQHSLGTHTRRPSHATPQREGRRTKTTATAQAAQAAKSLERRNAA